MTKGCIRRGGGGGIVCVEGRIRRQRVCSPSFLLCFSFFLNSSVPCAVCKHLRMPPEICFPPPFFSLIRCPSFCLIVQRHVRFHFVASLRKPV